MRPRLVRKVEGALNARSTFSSAPDTYLVTVVSNTPSLHPSWPPHRCPGSTETQLMSYPCTCGRPTSCHAPRPRPAHRACTRAVWSLDTVTWRGHYYTRNTWLETNLREVAQSYHLTLFIIANNLLATQFHVYFHGLMPFLQCVLIDF